MKDLKTITLQGTQNQMENLERAMEFSSNSMPKKVKPPTDKAFDILNQIDYPILKEQKAILINMISDWGEADDPDQRKDAYDAEGILNLINAIQEFAVSDLNYPEKKVFNSETT